MRKSIVTVLAALSVSGMIAVPAAADEVSVSVSYADLNIASEAGAARLHQRIAAAVDQVCAKPATRELKANAVWQKCRADTAAAALQAVPGRPAFAQVVARF